MLRDTQVSTRRASPARYALAVILIVACAGLVAGLRPSPLALAESQQSAGSSGHIEAQKLESQKNLKKIALAFHDYYDTHELRFPPPVLRGPDGKTPYSWRVELLPTLGEQQLYDEYDRNQPWDSPHNLKVLVKIPAVFRHPADDAVSTNAGYFVFTGEHTAVGGTDGQGVRIREITDGTSNTLLAVEARRDIPWTRPIDLPYVETEPPPKVGGWFDHGFCAAKVDGSAPFLKTPSDEQVLRAVITRDGYGVVDFETMTLTRPESDLSGTPNVSEDAFSTRSEGAASRDPGGDEAPADASKPTTILKYGDNNPDGKKSIAGTGEMVRFELPDKTQKLVSLRIHCARYGTPQAPKENAEFSIVSEDGSEIIHQEDVPYSSFKRGASRWTTIRFEEPVQVPEVFWVILDFDAHQTKGVFVSYDSSTGGEHSRTGVPGGEMKEVNTGGDWMVQAILSKPE